MLKHRIAIDNVELIVSKGKRFASHDLNMMYAWITGQNQFTIGQAGTSQIFPIRIKLFEHICLNSCVIAGSNIQDAILMCGVHFQLKKIIDPPPGNR